MPWIVALFFLAGVAMAAPPPGDAAVVDELQAAARPLVGGAGDYDGLLDAIGQAGIVMLGEATHGSREFYRERARITRRLIEEKGFSAVVFEAPWEPMRRLDAWVGGGNDDGNAEAALSGIIRFPRWTWRNEEMRDFAVWLRRRNLQPDVVPVRVHGMDLYSLPESARAVAAYLEGAATDEEARSARRDLQCFNDYPIEPQGYGEAVETRQAPSCGAGARRQLALMSLRHDAAAPAPSEELFAAWQSTHTVAAAEAYYRAMYRREASSWNLRERHMADTLDRLRDWPATHDAARGRAKIVVWAHNIHQGDARATDQAAAGEVSLGQLMRERHPGEVVLVGFSTYSGQVRAATRWGGRDRVKILKPALAESGSALLHRAGPPTYLLTFNDHPALAQALAASRPERAVGVIYLPDDERASHYFNVRLSRQFDALIHWDTTTPLVPLP